MLKIEPAEVRWFRWGARKGFYAKTDNGEVSARHGQFVALLSDWEAVQGTYGVQTHLILDFGMDNPITHHMWISGNHTPAFAKRGAGKWRFESKPKGSGSELSVLEADRVDDDEPMDFGILAMLFPPLPF